jgi:hypothetical protein
MRRVAGWTVATPVPSRNAKTSLGALCIQFLPTDEILGGIVFTQAVPGSKSLGLKLAAGARLEAGTRRK